METPFLFRPYHEGRKLELVAGGVSPVLAQALVARGVTAESMEKGSLGDLLHWGSLKGIRECAGILLEDIVESRRIVIVADYDADGATACSVGMKVLRGMGAKVDFVVPNRMTMGYGLSREAVDLAMARGAQTILTVDNGIASIDGVRYARENGVKVVVTDHHLPCSELPVANGIVNPNQPGCEFPSKHLAGVGVIFYLMLALRSVAVESGVNIPKVNMAEVLDLVALGTVADVVPLDHNNRILVKHGLERIRDGRCCAGIKALFDVGRRDIAEACSADLGFLIGPRVNAAGRMDDMGIGIRCLIEDDDGVAMNMAALLDEFNRNRKEVEQEMAAQARELIDSVDVASLTGGKSVVLFDPSWHIGVVGIVASRIKDVFFRPTIIFAQSQSGELRGSGRSIPGFHLRDALERVANEHKGMILRFGGHAAAAGLTIRPESVEDFTRAFEKVAQEMVTDEMLCLRVEYDAEVSLKDMDEDLARAIRGEVWGNGFPEPVFCGVFSVVEQRLIQGKHLKMVLEDDGVLREAIWFNHGEEIGWPVAKFGFTLDLNFFNGLAIPQILVKKELPFKNDVE